MFSQTHRISSLLFKKIIHKGKRFFSHNFRLHVYPDSLLRVSCVIPKKIIPKRVHRNHFKRQILDILKGLLKKHGYVHHWIFFMQKDISDLPRDLLVKELETLIIQAQIPLKK